MKLWILSDLHYGVHNNNYSLWLKNMNSYFYEFFIPLLKEHKKPNDKLIILGDIFDNRISINLFVINAVVKLFEDLSKIIEVHILIGNHDMALMNSTEINSDCVIRNINNIILYEEPKIINIDNKSILMMPWIHGKNEEKAVLEKYSGTDLLFCHSDLNGCRTQLNPTRPYDGHILDIEDFNGYGKVYSGHIHIVQEIKNFKFVGSPYHMDRNDVENKKGIYVYDTKKNTDMFIPNDFSPEFIKYKILEDTDMSQLKEDVIINNFIDIEVSNQLIINSPHIRLQLDKMCNKFKINNILFIDDVVTNKKEKKVHTYSKDKTIKEISNEWITNVKINENIDIFSDIEIKNKMKETVEECFKLHEISKKATH